MTATFHRAIETAANADDLVVKARKWLRVHGPSSRVYVSIHRLSVYEFPLNVLPQKRHRLMPAEDFLGRKSELTNIGRGD